jgi:hypothetical protein
MFIGDSGDGEGNIIASNNSYGIELDSAATAEGDGDGWIKGNIIENNGFASMESSAGAIYIHGGTEFATIVDNVIVNNKRGICIKDGKTWHIAVSNNVIYGSAVGPDIDLYPWGITGSGAWETESPYQQYKCNPPYDYPVLWIWEDGGSICALVRGKPFAEAFLYLAKDVDQELNGVYTDVYGRSHGGAVAVLGSVMLDSQGEQIICDLQVDNGDVVTALYISDYPPNTSEFGRNWAVTEVSFEATCPVELEVEDPYGNVINTTVNEIQGAYYDDVTDVNDDGDPDFRVFLPGKTAGDYSVRVIPKTGADPGATYSLRAVDGGDTAVVAEEETVPSQGETDDYVYTAEIPATCCGLYTGGYTGNCNCSDDGLITLNDITMLIDHVYITKADLCCEENGNVNGSEDGLITLADITGLIDHVYITKEPTAACP